MLNKIDAVFQTPIGEFEFTDSDVLNSQLTKEILEIEKNEKSEGNFQYSMNGNSGYHTKDDLLLRNSKIFTEFEEHLKKELNTFNVAVTGSPIPQGTKMVSWAMVYRVGDFSATHIHPDSDISCAYYPQIPTTMNKNHEKSLAMPGNFCYLDPRPAARFHGQYTSHSTYTVAPQQGHGLIFPGWLEHHTIPMIEESEPRICIATNIFFPKGNPDEGKNFY